MPTLDQFESVFKSAIKPIFQHVDPSIERGLIITDLGQDELEEFSKLVQQLLAKQKISEWEIISGLRPMLFDSE